MKKKIPSMHHPSKMVHWWVLVHSGLFFQVFYYITPFMTKLRVVVSVVCVNDLGLTLCVNVEYESCKCK